MIVPFRLGDAEAKRHLVEEGLFRQREALAAK